MKIKIISFIAAAVLLVSPAFARDSKAPNLYALGAAWNIGLDSAGGADLKGALVSFKLRKVPVVFGAGLSIRLALLCPLFGLLLGRLEILSNDNGRRSALFRVILDSFWRRQNAFL